MKAAWTTAEATSDTDMQLLRLKLGKENALAKCRDAAWPAKSLLVLLSNNSWLLPYWLLITDWPELHV